MDKKDTAYRLEIGFNSEIPMQHIEVHLNRMTVLTLIHELSGPLLDDRCEWFQFELSGWLEKKEDVSEDDHPDRAGE